MARGWESKSVEQQQEEMAERRKTVPPARSLDEQERNRKREGPRGAEGAILRAPRAALPRNCLRASVSARPFTPVWR